MKLQLAGIMRESIVDGPGIRLTIFAQGCPHRCRGCHNPETNDPLGGYPVEIDDLLQLVDSSSNIDGVTISGGEPFAQPGPVALLAGLIRKRDLDLVLYSGYTFEQLLLMAQGNQQIRIILEQGNLLVDGPFRLEERDISLAFRGSRNQRIIDLSATLHSGQIVEWSGELIY